MSAHIGGNGTLAPALNLKVMTSCPVFFYKMFTRAFWRLHYIVIIRSAEVVNAHTSGTSNFDPVTRDDRLISHR